MGLDDLRKKHPQARYPLLITEVTRMRASQICVAAYDIHQNRIVRPLQANHHNWPDHLYASGTLRAGAIIYCMPSGGAGGGMSPHSTEDSPLQATPVKAAELDESELYATLLPTADPNVQAIFNGTIIDGKYVTDGTNCRSLGSVSVSPRRVLFHVSFDRLRCTFEDNTGATYDLPVTSMDLLSIFGNQASAMFGVDEANELLRQYDDKEPCILRIGLARGWDGKPNNNWNPKRCYAQLNGLIFCEDRMYIFAGPPGDDHEDT